MNPTPGVFARTQTMKQFIWGSLFIGFLTLVIGFLNDPARVWQALLVNTFYFSSLALGGLFFTSIQHATNAGWSVTVRRVSESFVSFLPYAFVAAIVVAVFGGKSLFEWMRPEQVASDAVIAAKSSYLNANFFFVRTAVFFGLWILLGKRIVGNSLLQDKSGDEKLTLDNVKFSVIFLLIFALSYSLFSVDFVMSLDSKWFSTIFGVYCFAGLFQSTLAFAIIMLVVLMRRGLLNGFVNENHLHDLGKFLFAFTVFYAYIAFSQFMLIWYANVPEETFWFIKRGLGGWMGVSYSLLVLKFMVPFFLLLPRAAKRNPTHLLRMSVLMLVMQYVDIYWLVYPKFHKSPVLPLYDIGIFLGFLSLFLIAVTKFLAKNSIVPVRDPRIHEALHHHI